MQRRYNKYLTSNQVIKGEQRRRRLMRSMLIIFVIAIVLTVGYFYCKNKYDRITFAYQYLESQPLVTRSHATEWTKTQPFSLLVVANGHQFHQGEEQIATQMIAQVFVNPEHEETKVYQLPTNAVPNWDLTLLPLRDVISQKGQGTLLEQLESLTSLKYDYMLTIDLTQLPQLVGSLKEITITPSESQNFSNLSWQAGQTLSLNQSQVESLLQQVGTLDAMPQAIVIQDLLLGVLKELSSYPNIWHLDHLLKAAHDCIQTSIPLRLARHYYLGGYDDTLSHSELKRVTGQTKTHDKDDIVIIDPNILDEIHHLGQSLTGHQE